MKKEKVVMVGFKGYSKGLVCSPGNKPKKYKENTVFTEDNASICNNGMHFCANPLSVFQYYPPKNNNEFTTIEALDKCDTDDNVKYCTKKLRVGVKITIPAIIKAGIEFIFEKSKVSDSYSSTSATSGDSSTSATSGDYSTSATSGDYSTSATSGDSSTSATSGDYSTSATSGYYSTSATSGDSSTSATSGNYSTSATSGDSSTSATSGDNSTSATSGNYSTSATSGYYSTSATSGDSSTSAVNGKNSVAVANGNECKVKGVLGCYLVLTEYDHDTDKFFAKMRKVDGKHIKENVYYTLKDGKFKEVK